MSILYEHENKQEKKIGFEKALFYSIPSCDFFEFAIRDQRLDSVVDKQDDLNNGLTGRISYSKKRYSRVYMCGSKLSDTYRNVNHRFQ